MKVVWVILLTMLGLISQVQAHQPDDSALLMPGPFESWKTLHTPHFHIHYQEQRLSFAQQVAAVAERVFAQQTMEYQWQPDGPVEVIINDAYDGSNGGATVLAYNRFFIFLNGPVEGELQDNAPWIEQVFVHELIHILHMDQAEGLPAGLRSVFGRQFFTFPQIFSPTWLSEGIAVFGETDQEKGFGRGQSALYDAMMRAEVQNGFRTYSQMNYQGYWGTDWPSGQSYLYGYYFFEFLEQTYGHERLMAYLKNWNSNLIPWRMDSRAQEAFGMGAEALWDEYLAYLRKKFVPQIAALQTSESTALVDDGRINADPVWLKNGDFYFYRNDGRHKPSIEKITANGQQKTLAKVDQFLGLAVHEQAGVLISRNVICNNRNVFSDLYRLQENGRWQRITHCGRYPRMAWSAAGKQIAAVQVQEGRSRIVLLDENGQLQKNYDALPLGEVIGHPAFSPDDRLLVAAVRRNNSGWNLELLDLETGQWQRLTQDANLQQRPQFSADGQWIYFLSDQESRWDVRRLHLDSGRQQSLTATPTAVTGFAVAASGELIRTAEYTAKGIMLRQQQAQPLELAVEQTLRVPASLDQQEGFDPQQYQNISDYSPWQTLRPHAWFALLYADSKDNNTLQFLLDGQDALARHYWQFAPAFYLDKEKIGGSATYIAHHRLALVWDSIIKTRTEARTDVLEQWDTETRYQAVWMQPFNSFDGTFRVDLGVGTEKVEREVERYGTLGQFKDNFAGLALSWADYDVYLHSVSPENGRWIKLTQEKYDAFGNSWHQGSALTLDWREYLSFGNNQVLALRAVAGKADAQAKPYELGGALDQIESLGGLIGFGKTGYTLRGYDDGSAELTGNSLRLLSAEWRIPLAEVFDGFNTLPLGLGKTSLSLFADHGGAWYPKEGHRYYTGVGVELKPDLLLGFGLLMLNTTVGYAQGLDDNLGEKQFYLRLGMAF